MHGPIERVEPQCIIDFGGVLNLRDVGGYPTRDGRRNPLAHPPSFGVPRYPGHRRQSWLADGGLRTIIDVAFSGTAASGDLVIDLRRGYRREHAAQTPPERMLLTLEYLDQQWGGVRPYLPQHGLAQRSLNDLTAALIEPSQSASATP